MKQVVFITGASSGIGYALARELAPKGYALALAARRKDLLDELCDEVRRLGGEALALGCDVGNQSQVRHSIAETVARFGRIDLAILSAGFSEPTRSVKFSAGQFERMLRTNLLGVAFCLEELIPLMLQQQGGMIAAVSSLAGDRGMPGSAGYCATKAALSALFDGMRVELRERGIRLVTIEPGYVLTPMTESFGKMPFLMQADEAARLILRRMEQGDRVIRFPLISSVVMKLIRMLPVTLFDKIAAKRRPVRVDAKSSFSNPSHD